MSQQAHDRVLSHLDTLRRIESEEEAAEREAAEATAATAADDEELLRSARRDSYLQELARKAALAQAEAREVSERQVEHRTKLDSMRVQTEQQARDVEQARLYEHDAEMKQLQAQEKKKVGWGPSILAILLLGALGAGAYFGLFVPMTRQAAVDTQLERQRVVDESLKRRDAEQAKDEAARLVEQEQERLRRTQAAIRAAAATEASTPSTPARRRATRGTGQPTDQAEPPRPAPSTAPEFDPLDGL